MWTTMPEAPTFTVMLAEAIAPGSGFSTLKDTDIPFCAEVVVPVAVSSVAETNFVISAWPPNITLAPLTNFVPVMVMEKLPTGTKAGETAVTVGTGFSSVIMFLPERVLSDEEIASTVIVFGEGRVAGALYRPLALIVPTMELPPATPLIDQATVWSIALVTFAENCRVSPVRTLLEGAVTTTPFELD